MAMKRSRALLDRLRGAVERMRLLLSFNATKWIVSAIARQPSRPRRLSFKTQRSLLDFTEGDDVELPRRVISRTASSTSRYVSRSTSGASPTSRYVSRSTSGASTTGDVSPSDEDIDKRSDNFIESFYQHLLMERQVSLELRYSRREDQL